MKKRSINEDARFAHKTRRKEEAQNAVGDPSYHSHQTS